MNIDQYKVLLTICFKNIFQLPPSVPHPELGSKVYRQPFATDHQFYQTGQKISEYLPCIQVAGPSMKCHLKYLLLVNSIVPNYYKCVCLFNIVLLFQIMLITSTSKYNIVKNTLWLFYKCNKTFMMTKLSTYLNLHKHLIQPLQKIKFSFNLKLHYWTWPQLQSMESRTLHISHKSS